MVDNGEIITPLLVLREGETHTADEGGALVATERHTHSDILRYVVADIGSDALHIVQELLGTNKDAKDD